MRLARRLNLVHRERMMRPRQRALHRLLHLLEGTRFDLSHPLPRDTGLGGQLLQRLWWVGEPACFEDATLAVAEDGERLIQRLPALICLLALCEMRLLVRPLVDQPVLPLAGIVVLAKLCIQ